MDPVLRGAALTAIGFMPPEEGDALHDAALAAARAVPGAPFVEVGSYCGRSTTVSALWRTPLSMVFIDGGHAEVHAQNDYTGWAPWLVTGGFLVIHDVFPDPADGGRPPYEEIFLPALESGRFRLASATGSLRILTRVD